MLLLFLACLALGGWAGYVVARRSLKPKFLLHLEYWVYLPGERMPPQDEVMTRLIDSRAIGSAEALLFSDVRLHIALVLRSKNAYLFRPDLIEPTVDATPEQIALLAEARSFAKVRFLSEEPVSDRRYLAFLPQAARIIAELGGGGLVYDVMGERLLGPGDLAKGDPGPQTSWVAEPTGGHVETRGLKKIGLPEIRTESVAADERWIATEVVDRVAQTAWKLNDLPLSVTTEAFHDRFRLDFVVDRHNVANARIHRIQTV